MQNTADVNDLLAGRWRAPGTLKVLQRGSTHRSAGRGDEEGLDVIQSKAAEGSRRILATRVEAMVRVLQEAGGPMTVPDIAKVALEKGYWITGSKHTVANLRSALHREIFLRGERSRFSQIKRGVFALTESREKS